MGAVLTVATSHMTRHLQECVCSRLYVAVRDKLNLTYDVSFTLEQHDRLNASWWFVNVTASPDLVAKATQACVEVRALLSFLHCDRDARCRALSCGRDVCLHPADCDALGV